MTDQILKEFHDGIVKLAQKMFEDTGCVLATYICVDNNDILFPLPAPPVNSGNVQAAIMRAFFKKANVVMYAYIDEAWMLDSIVFKDCKTSDEQLKKLNEEFDRYGSVREHPNRLECVQVISERGMETLTSSLMIHRPKEGRPTLESDGPTSSVSTGRFTGLLMPNRTVQ